jgi:uncharacterized membrane protein
MNASDIHLVLNHVPVVGLVGALLVLGWGVARRSNEVLMLGFLLTVVIALFTIPAYLSGEAAEEITESANVAKSQVEAHEEAALLSLVMISATGLVALFALVMQFARKSRPLPFAAATLVVGLIAFALVARAAHLGGQIMHGAQNGAITSAAQNHDDD